MENGLRQEINSCHITSLIDYIVLEHSLALSEYLHIVVLFHGKGTVGKHAVVFVLNTNFLNVMHNFAGMVHKEDTT